MLLRLAVAAAVAVLSACGGGGSGGENTPSPDTPISVNVDAAFATALTGGLSVTGLAATDAQGNTLILNVSQSPGADATFFGSTQKRSIRTAAITRNGAALPTQTAQVFYSTAPFRQIGTIESDGLFLLYTPSATLPTAAGVGSSGPFESFTIFPSTSTAVNIGTGAVTWSVESDTGGTALACLNTASPSLGPQSVCLRVDATGAIRGSVVRLTVGGALLTFR